jgi:SAM-dependent methyltransferase
MNYEDFKAQNDNQDIHFWYRARKELIRKILLSATKKKDNKILEVGCGIGYNFDLLGEFGEIEGFDNDSKVIDIARDRKIDISCTSLEDFDMPENYYDIICCFDVLEHIKDDRLALKKIRGGLKEGGVFIFTVPAFPSIIGAHDLAMGHQRRYTKKYLRLKIRENGFDLLTLNYWNITLFPLIYLIRKIKRISFDQNNRKKSFDTEIKKTNKIVDFLLFNLLKLESKLPVGLRMPYGLTIYGVVKK